MHSWSAWCQSAISVKQFVIYLDITRQQTQKTLGLNKKTLSILGEIHWSTLFCYRLGSLPNIRIDKGIFYKDNQNHSISKRRTYCFRFSLRQFILYYQFILFETRKILNLKNNSGIFNTFLIYQLFSEFYNWIFWEKKIFRKIIVSSFKVDTNKGFYSMSNM